MKFVVRTGIASLVLLLLEAGRHLSWQEAASALLVCVVLCWMAERSQAAGVELVVTLGGFYFILVSLTTIPEGVLFDVINVRVAPLVMVRELGIALALAMTIAALFAKFKATAGATPTPSGEMTIFGLLWRMVAAIVVFLVCYFGAGMLIFPMVKGYYQGRNMPDPVAMVAMVVLRVVCLIVTTWLATRRIPNRRDARLILATAFPVIGVFSLMLHHNELMPPGVRWVHTMEMTPYYALCGFLFAVWFGPRRAAESPQSEQNS
jgi:hypothetical protein